MYRHIVKVGYYLKMADFKVTIYFKNFRRIVKS